MSVQASTHNAPASSAASEVRSRGGSPHGSRKSDIANRKSPPRRPSGAPQPDSEVESGKSEVGCLHSLPLRALPGFPIWNRKSDLGTSPCGSRKSENGSLKSTPSRQSSSPGGGSRIRKPPPTGVGNRKSEHYSPLSSLRAPHPKSEVGSWSLAYGNRTSETGVGSLNFTHSPSPPKYPSGVGSPIRGPLPTGAGGLPRRSRNLEVGSLHPCVGSLPPPPRFPHLESAVRTGDLPPEPPSLSRNPGTCPGGSRKSEVYTPPFFRSSPSGVGS